MINRIFEATITLSFLIIYVLGHYDFPLLLPIVVFINTCCIGFGYYIGTLHKKDVHSIIFSIRVGVSLKNTLPLFISLGLYFILEYAIDYFLDLFKRESPFIYVAPLILAMYFGMKYQSTMNSIRIYKNGIKLPGSYSEIIPWDHIQSVEREHTVARIQYNNNIKTIKIIKPDLHHFDKLIDLQNNLSSSR